MDFDFIRRLVSCNRRVPRPRSRSNYSPRFENLETRLVLNAGGLDPSFGTGGEVLTDFTIAVDLPGNDAVRQVAVQQADGKIVVAGGTSNFLVGGNAVALARYNEDGSLDNTFGDDGRVSDRFRVLPEITGIALQSDGKIVVAGYSFVEGSGDFFLARYNTNGTLDTSFDSDGWLTTDFGSDDLA